MVSRRFWSLGNRGFTAAELLTVVSILVVVVGASVPFLLSYWRAATLKASAEELAAALNRARQVAIARNQSVCVEVLDGRYRYRVGGCTGTISTGAGTDSTGFFRLENHVTLTTNGNPVFSYLGAAAPGATFTVTHPQGGATLNVVVSASGRVQIQ